MNSDSNALSDQGRHWGLAGEEGSLVKLCTNKQKVRYYRHLPYLGKNFSLLDKINILQVINPFVSPSIMGFSFFMFLGYKSTVMSLKILYFHVYT